MPDDVFFPVHMFCGKTAWKFSLPGYEHLKATLSWLAGDISMIRWVEIIGAISETHARVAVTALNACSFAL